MKPGQADAVAADVLLAGVNGTANDAFRCHATKTHVGAGG